MTASVTPKRWIPSTSNFGARLALIRQGKGWTSVKEAATSCGVPQGSWQDWEKNDRKPRDFESVCQKISKAAGCDLYWLMTGLDASSLTHEYVTDKSGIAEEQNPRSHRGRGHLIGSKMTGMDGRLPRRVKPKLT